jgi:hypothetical protein
MKTALKWTLVLLIFAAPGWAEAITVSITATRGTSTPVTVNPTITFTAAGNPAVALACTNPTGANSPVGTAICTRTISVGGTTVTLTDISTQNRARVYRIDAGSDILHVAGLQARSGTGITTTSGVTLKISYSSNEYAKLNYGLYSYTAAMSGNLFNQNGQTPIACTPTTPCLTLKLKANLVDVNQFGPVATVVVPPIGTGGAFGPPNLNPSETKSINCGTPPPAAQPSCTPSLQGELTWIIKSPSETLRVVAGAVIGGSHRPVWAGGVTDTYVDVAAPENLVPPLIPFVVYNQEATLQATLAQEGGRFPNLQEGSDLPLWWDLNKADETNFTVEDATLLRSIVSNADLFDDGAVVSFVSPQPAKVRDIKSIVADYAWEIGNCSDSLFVELQLATLQVIKIPLGCDSSGDNLVADGTSVQLPNGSTTTFKSMLQQFGGTDLRAISVVLAKNTANEDQEVALTSFTIGAFKTTFARSGGRSPIFPTGNQLFCDFPGLNEFMVRVTPVDAAGNPVGPSFIWGDTANEALTFSKAENVPVANDCQLRTAIKVTEFPAHDRENGWRFELLYNLVPVGDGFISVARDR